MRINVRVKPKAHKQYIQKVSEHHYTVGVTQEPKDGGTTGAVISVLSQYFLIPKNTITLESGETSSHKVFIISTVKIKKPSLAMQDQVS